MNALLKQVPSDKIKIVLFGPESTGKTTLSQQLARYYDTVWVEEYARAYLQNKWNNHRKTCTHEDLLPIALGQMALENDLVNKADKVLICDTDLLETQVYSEEYYGGLVDPELETAVKINTYDLYLLTYIDVPWEVDDLRDSPNHREQIFNAFKRALIKHNKNFITLTGNKAQRLKKATTAIDKILVEQMNTKKQKI